MFERSIRGLRALNVVGFGVSGSGLRLDLVYNPGGAFLPPPQESSCLRNGMHLEYPRANHRTMSPVSVCTSSTRFTFIYMLQNLLSSLEYN